MKKYDKVFIPVDDNNFDFIIMHKESIFSRKEQIPIKELQNVVILTEEEYKEVDVLKMELQSWKDENFENVDRANEVILEKEERIKELEYALQQAINLLNDSDREIRKYANGTHDLKLNIPQYLFKIEQLLNKKD